MTIAAFVLPVFGVILAGWLAGAVGYLPRSLSGPLVQFAYNVAMPALIFLAIARESFDQLLDWGFIAAYGGGSLLVFAGVAIAARLVGGRDAGAAALLGALAAMTNTGFVALPILQAMYGEKGILPAAIASVFIAVVLFPVCVILLERAAHDGAARQQGTDGAGLLRRVLLNPLMVSTVAGIAWSLSGIALPAWLAGFTGIFAAAMTPCALFAIGLGLTLDVLRGEWRPAALLTVMKLVLTPVPVLLLAHLLGLDAFQTVAAVVCAAVPTAKTAYILAGEYRREEGLTGATVSLSTLASVGSLLAWLYLLT
ncbi:AEC family transporter [Marinibaculum pumilum]|uniref:AEC family transporter n=1 Tax=Marinibaculum pumilum TaxID=1766165 RepID=A0ABV7L9S7_9PROT